MTKLFQDIGVKCASNDENYRIWTKDYHPSYTSSNGICQGYVKVPNFVACSLANISKSLKLKGIQRFCNCTEKGKSIKDISDRRLLSVSIFLISQVCFYTHSVVTHFKLRFIGIIAIFNTLRNKFIFSMTTSKRFICFLWLVPHWLPIQNIHFPL